MLLVGSSQELLVMIRRICEGDCRRVFVHWAYILDKGILLCYITNILRSLMRLKHFEGVGNAAALRL
jgi:hypothetical protein